MQALRRALHSLRLSSTQVPSTLHRTELGWKSHVCSFCRVVDSSSIQQCVTSLRKCPPFDVLYVYVYIHTLILHNNLDLQCIYTVNQMWCKCVIKYGICGINKIINTKDSFTSIHICTIFE